MKENGEELGKTGQVDFCGDLILSEGDRGKLGKLVEDSGKVYRESLNPSKLSWEYCICFSIPVSQSFAEKSPWEAWSWCKCGVCWI